jgi:dynactin 1
LRFKRLSFKARILRTFILEQHTVSADPKSKPASFDADHAIARTLVMEQLIQIQSITSTFGQYFSKCDGAEFEGASAIFHELDPVEKGLDSWLTSLRSGEMNERACSESLHGYLL